MGRGARRGAAGGRREEKRSDGQDCEIEQVGPKPGACLRHCHAVARAHHHGHAGPFHLNPFEHKQFHFPTPWISPMEERREEIQIQRAPLTDIPRRLAVDRARHHAGSGGAFNHSLSVASDHFHTHHQ